MAVLSYYHHGRRCRKEKPADLHFRYNWHLGATARSISEQYLTLEVYNVEYVYNFCTSILIFAMYFNVCN